MNMTRFSLHCDNILALRSSVSELVQVDKRYVCSLELVFVFRVEFLLFIVALY